MFKFVAISALLAVACAAPSGWHSPSAHTTIVHSAPHVTYEHVHGVQEIGKIVDHIPSGVSHSSSSVVHSHAAIETPIIAPVHKTYVAHAAPVHHVHHEQPAAHYIAHEPAHYIAHEPAHHVVHSAPHISYEHVHGVQEVAKIVEHVPTSVSHSSSSVVHSHGAVVTPIVAPVHKTYVSPVVHHHEAYVAPVHSVYHAAPVAHHSVSHW